MKVNETVQVTIPWEKRIEEPKSGLTLETIFYTGGGGGAAVTITVDRGDKIYKPVQLSLADKEPKETADDFRIRLVDVITKDWPKSVLRGGGTKPVKVVVDITRVK